MYKIKFPLYLISFIYGLVVYIRNMLYDYKLISSRSFDTPVISVGNLRVGGSGKTPHVEYLINLLQDSVDVAVISRGYKRKTRGHFEVKTSSAYHETGDEPLMMKRKFPGIRIVVNKNRVQGIDRLISDKSNPDVILLDDAFQHRKVRPSLNILLTPYHHLYTDDRILPLGYLREHKRNATRADIIVVTKSPESLSNNQVESIKHKLNVKGNQQIFFSSMRILGVKAINPEHQKKSEDLDVYSVVLLTAIADNEPINEYLKNNCKELTVFSLPDHHDFSHRDIKKVIAKFDNIVNEKKMIVVTQKDVVRLKKTYDDIVISEHPFYYLHYEVCFHGSDKQKFNDLILCHVGKN